MGENPLTILGWGQGEVAPFPFKPVPLATLWASILGLGGRYCFGNWEKLCEVCLSQMLFFTRTRCFSKRKTLKAFWEALVQHPRRLLLAQWVWAHMVPWGSMEIHTMETSLPPCCPPAAQLWVTTQPHPALLHIKVTLDSEASMAVLLSQFQCAPSGKETGSGQLWSSVPDQL